MAARRTTLNIDHDKVATAQAILGTETTTATVHKALDEVIRRFHMESLLEWDFGGMGLADLEEMRRPKLERWSVESQLPDDEVEAS